MNVYMTFLKTEAGMVGIFEFCFACIRFSTLNFRYNIENPIQFNQSFPGNPTLTAHSGRWRVVFVFTFIISESTLYTNQIIKVTYPTLQSAESYLLVCVNWWYESRLLLLKASNPSVILPQIHIYNGSAIKKKRSY